MGKNNRERRAAKRRRQRGSGPGGSRPPTGGRAGRPHGGPDTATAVEALAWQAVAAWRASDPRYGVLLAALDDRGESALAVLRVTLERAVAPLWQRGWTAAEAVHVTKRSLSDRHAELIARVALDQVGGRVGRGEAVHPRWEAELGVLSMQLAGAPLPCHASVLVEALGFVAGLPEVPRTVPAPGASLVATGAAGRLDERMLSRVRALLAKAESTEFSEEAEALTAKAQELIARHAIDEALLDRQDAGGSPAVRRLLLDDPYADVKASLVAAVATANRCRAVHSPAFAWSTVFGFDSDLDAVELLTASLLTQATRAMTRHGPRRDVRGRSTTRSFRRAFLLGFAHRIGQRLSEVFDAADAQADQERLLPVLASRAERVAAAEQAMFPRLVHRSSSLSNASGWTAGQAAADLAELGLGARKLADR